MKKGRRGAAVAGTATHIKGALQAIAPHLGNNNGPVMSTTSPLYNRRRVADPNGSEARKARLLMEDPAGKLFDEAKTVYNLCRIRPFHLSRSTAQKQATLFITTKKQWNTVKRDFVDVVLKEKFISFDLEWYLPDHAELEKKKKDGKAIEWHEEKRLRYVLVGTLRGRAAVFDMDSLPAG